MRKNFKNERRIREIEREVAQNLLVLILIMEENKEEKGRNLKMRKISITY